MLAMNVNDNACSLNAHVVLTFFVGTPPGACRSGHPLLQTAVRSAFAFDLDLPRSKPLKARPQIGRAKGIARTENEPPGHIAQ